MPPAGKPDVSLYPREQAGLFRSYRGRLALGEREALCLFAAFCVFLDVVFAFAVSHKGATRHRSHLGRNAFPDGAGRVLPEDFAIV
jgi:hypothetical protein